jgi:hypothetical protein
MSDRYTKIVLTVIAVCLLKIAFGDLIAPAEAQGNRRYVVYSNSDLSQFAQAIDDSLASGWKLQGGVSFHPKTGAPAQAMYLPR